MKAFLLAVLAIAVIAVGANMGLESMDFSTAAANVGDNVRLD